MDPLEQLLAEKRGGGRNAPSDPLSQLMEQRKRETEEDMLFGSPLADVAAGVPETALSMATGVGAAIGSGYAGLYQLGMGRPDRVTETIESTMADLTYNPRSQSGKYIQGLIAEVLMPFDTGKNIAANTVYDVTDNPFIAAQFRGGLDVMETILGFKGMMKVPELTRRVGSITRGTTPTRQEVAAVALDEGLPVEDAYNIKVSPSETPGGLPKIREDSRGAALHTNHGLSKSDVSFLKTLNTEELATAKQMLKIYRGQRFTNDPKSTNRYIDPVGESVATRVEALMNVRRARGKQLERLVQSPEFGSRSINIGQGLGQWVNEAMKTFNLKVIANPEGGFTFDYSRSPLKNNPSAQRAIGNILESINSGEFTAKDLHFVKGLIDEEITPSASPQGSQGGVKGKLSQSFMALRSIINDSIGQVIPEYARINGDISEIIDILEPVVSATGKSIDLSSKEGAKQLALAIRRISSNAKVGVVMRENLPQLMELVDKHFKGVFKDDPRMLQTFASILESRYGSDVAHSLGGIVDASNERLAMDAAGLAVDAVAGNTPGLMSRAASAAGGFFSKKETNLDANLKAILDYFDELERDLYARQAAQGNASRSRQRGQQR